MKQYRVGERGFLTFFVSGVFLPVAPYKYMGGYEAKSPTFSKNVRENLENLRLFLSFLQAKISRKGCLAKRMSIISWESLIFAVREVAQMGILALF